MEAFVGELAAWSYGAVFLVMLLEGLGAPVPGHSLYLAAVVLATQPGSTLSLPLLVAACIGGSAIGGPLGYRLGQWCVGSAWVARAVTHPTLRAQRARYLAAQHIISEQSGKTVLFARYMPVLCFAAGPLAGLIRMDFRRYMLLNLAGICLWTATHTTLGVVLGRSLNVLSQVTGGIGAIMIVGIAILAFVSWRRLRPHQKGRMADDAA